LNKLHQLDTKYVLSLVNEERFQEAESICSHFSEQSPRNPLGHYLLACIYGKQGRHEDAEKYCQRVIELAPEHVAALYNLSISLRETGDIEGAYEAIEKVIALSPDYPSAQGVRGHLLVSMNRYKEAEKIFLGMADLGSGDASAYFALGSVMQAVWQLDVAENYYNMALQAGYVQVADILDAISSIHSLKGDQVKSIETRRDALAIHQDKARIYSSLLFTYQYTSDINAERLFSLHRKWRRYTSSGRIYRDYPCLKSSGKIRIGYVSSDFREHSVAYFIEPVLKRHDRSKYEIYCYSNSSRVDSVTRQLISYTDYWRTVENLDDKQLADQIFSDKIGILVDLNGHTAGNRLCVFTMKPAPIQITYLGYPGTTGLSTMDYRFTDPTADPVGEDHLYTEKLIRIPFFLAYSFVDNNLAIAETPALKNGYITFGSFNNLAKISDQVIEVWSQLLQHIPDARLLLKNAAFSDASIKERYIKLFCLHGLSRNRLLFVGFTSSTKEHLGTYARVDIALDTFPYNGTTTTCEALSMGVPVVSYCGKHHRQRVGASILTHHGHANWVADGVDQYVHIAEKLSRDTHFLSALRQSIGSTFRQSCSHDGRNVTRGIESEYARIWSVYRESHRNS